MKRTDKLGILLMILLICMMAFIFYMSSRDVDQSMHDSIGFDWILASWFVDGFDKMSPEEQYAAAVIYDEPIRHIAHTLEFFILGMLGAAVCRMFCFRANDCRKKRFNTWYIIAIAGGILYGILDEIHQIFVPGRGCQISDMCFDALGVVMGVAVVVIIERVKKNTSL